MGKDKKLNLSERIFSIKNIKRRYKQICFMGFKIKFKRVYRNKHVFEKLPINPRKIILESCLGGYNCNPKYIVEEILKRNLLYEIVWAADKKTRLIGFPEEVRIVKKGSKSYYKECATAKIWISNERIKKCVNYGLYKRPEQYYINTWHGSLGGKKCTADRGTLSFDEMKPYMIEATQVDYLISNSSYEDDFFRRMFWNNGQVLRLGHARNDIFFNNSKKEYFKEQFFTKYKIPKDCKIVMYAPTFRDDFDTSAYSIETDKLMEVLNKKYGGEWVVLMRLHPQLSKLKEKPIYPYRVINATEHPDMQELLVISDIFITDYSSSVFDFMLTKRPAFIFATDIEKYNDERGLYDPLETTPFPIATNDEELWQNIMNFNEQKYQKDVNKFLEFKGCMEDGQASKRVVDLIESIIGEV